MVSSTRLLMEMQGAGLRISQEGDHYSLQVGDLSGLANDLLDAIVSVLQCLVMERAEEVRA